MFFLPTDNQKLELNLSNIHEFRFGGEMFPEIPAYLTQQSEERTHDVWMASADYQINFNEDKSSLITYLAWQDTHRKHYTGTQPDKGTPEYDEWVANPPYGTSDVVTYNVGLQFNHRFDNFLHGKNVLTLGTEYVYDDVYDEIPTYNYKTDQTTEDFGMFLQSDWEIIPNLTLLSGVRMDKHNLLDKVIFSPRASILYKYRKTTQFRFSYGTGFRAPQAFDTDLHIAFAGGGVSRITLADDLKQEDSESFSASINYDKPTEHWIAGFTIEAFHNHLTGVFYQHPNGSDEYGDLFEKRNGDGATIKGATLELRGNFERKVQLECGFTWQSSKYDNAVAPGGVDGLEPTREFMRAPNQYGFAVLNFTPNRKWNATVNYVYTGEMKMPHVAGEGTGHDTDILFTSEKFSEFSAKIGYTLEIESFNSKFEIYGGIKNFTNAYQKAFDIGKNRDSNFTYGPAQPRTFYFGLKMKFN